MTTALTASAEHDIGTILGADRAAVVLPRLRQLVLLDRTRQRVLGLGNETPRRRVDADVVRVAKAALGFVDTVKDLSPAHRQALVVVLQTLGPREMKSATGITLARCIVALRRFAQYQERFSRRKRGRPPNTHRRAVLMQLVHILNQAGVRLTKGRKGQTYQISDIVLTAVNDRVQDFFHDLKFAIEHFTPDAPDTMRPTPRSRHISR